MSIPADAMVNGYTPPGPVAQAFIADTTHELVGIMGPFGSGKTSALPIKAMVITELQPPNKHDGVIRSKGYVIRDTYRNLEDKALPSWLAVLPDCDDWPLTGSKGGPRTQVVKWDRMIRGRLQRFEMIVEFRAIGDTNYEDFAKGLLATWIILNEADTMPGGCVDPLLGRLGRFPLPHEVADDCKPGFGCVMCDFNAPKVTNWTYRRLVLRRMLSGGASNAMCYIQPSGLDPAAENPQLRKLKPNYYEAMLANMEEWEGNRFVRNLPGYARSGSPVYTNFDSGYHVLKPSRGHVQGAPILWGVDGKLNAAAVAGQRWHTGQLHVITSLVTPNGEVTDAQTFGKLVRAEMSGRFAGSAGLAMLDPSLIQRESNTPDMATWRDDFAAEAGIPCVYAPTNAIEKRHRAVRNGLNGRIGKEPMLLINDSGNDTLIDGFIASYQVRKIRNGEDPKYQDQPDKGHPSHVHDAMQYLALLAGLDPEFVDLAVEYQAEIIRTRRDAKMGAGAAMAGGNVINDW